YVSLRQIRGSYTPNDSGLVSRYPRALNGLHEAQRETHVGEHERIGVRRYWPRAATRSVAQPANSGEKVDSRLADEGRSVNGALRRQQHAGDKQPRQEDGRQPPEQLVRDQRPRETGKTKRIQQGRSAERACQVSRGHANTRSQLAFSRVRHRTVRERV